MKHEHKSVPLEINEISESGVFEGYASVFNTVDTWDDIVIAGAFSESLQGHKAKNTMPALLWQHDFKQPIGIWLDMKEDAHGLYVKGQLLKDDVQKAKEAFALVKAKAISGISIGYITRDYSYDEKTYIRTVKKVDLLEASLVTFPANDQAKVTNIKSQLPTTIREFEATLRDVMGFSANEAKRIASQGFKARDVQEDEKICDLLKQIITKYKNQ